MNENINEKDVALEDEVKDEAESTNEETAENCAESSSEPTADKIAEDIADLKEAKEAAEKALAAYEDKFLRLSAEYDNFRKRSVKEKADIYPEATARAVEAFLPMADNFERALMAETTDEKYKSGVQMIYNQLCEAFKSLGVEVIDRVGEEFDPNLENAVSRIDSDEYGENIVAQVYQKGYKKGDKVIRPAVVVVANA